jgi:phage terminase large subunit-like protein
VGVDFLNGIEKILRPELARWLPLSELKGGSWDTAYSKELRTLTLENGSFVEFMSYDQDLDKFAGTSRHFVHFDEEPPQDIYTENITRLVDVAGHWWITMTPIEGMTWIYDDVYLKGRNDVKSGIKVIEVDMKDNPYLNQGEVDSFLSKLSKEDREARGKGKFIQVGGLVYKHFNPSVHVIDPMVPPKTWEWYASMDHGYNNPTCWLWHAVSPDGVVITFAEHYQAEMTVDDHASIVHMRNAGFGRTPDLFIGDPAIAQRQGVTGVSIQQAYAELGIGIVSGNNDVLAGVNRINQYLNINSEGRPRWYITRNCQNLIHEMQRLRWKTYATKRLQHDNNKQDAIHKKDDHAPDAARYFFISMPDLGPQTPTKKSSDVINQIGATTPQIGIKDLSLSQSLAAAVHGQHSTKWETEFMSEEVSIY